MAVGGSTIATGKEETDQRAYAEGDTYRVIRMVAHCFVRHFRPLDGLLLQTTESVLSIIQHSQKALASFYDFFFGRIGGGVKQRVNIFGKRAQVITYFFCLSVHVFFLSFFGFINEPSSNNIESSSSQQVFF